MLKLSTPQQIIYDFIKSYQETHGYPPSVREICSAVGLRSTSTVHGHLERLEKKGLIRRETVPNDARLKKLVLTPNGKKLQAAIERDQQETERLLRQGVTEEELQMFFQVMEKFKKNIQ